MSWDEYPAYVSVAQRKKNAAKKAKALEKQGYVLEPIGKLKSPMKIATSFWGRSWCRHLESFSDYSNRLPRGRTYVRNESILHLHIESGKVTAMVNGSELYELEIAIDPLPTAQWTAVKKACQGKIATLIELLQGKISDEIMTVVTDPKTGLFPKPKQIHFNCNCPDWADMCKHIAAVLYGVGARLDDSPELLFTLRGVDQNELISLDTAQQTITSGSRRSRRRTLSDDAVNNVFGIEAEEEESTIEQAAPKPRKSQKATSEKATKKRAPKGGAKRATSFSPTAAKVRKLRKHLGLSKNAFAKAVGASAPTITNWEAKTGKLKLQPEHIEALIRLSDS
jgi:uncharacterized Zn finger protein